MRVSHETSHALVYLDFFVEGMEREGLLPATMVEQTKIPGLEPTKITPVPVHAQEHNSSLKLDMAVMNELSKDS